MIQRINATHFIEVSKDSLNQKTVYSNIQKIEYLESFLETSWMFGFNTIAIWKVKFKKPTVNEA